MATKTGKRSKNAAASEDGKVVKLTVFSTFHGWYAGVDDRRAFSGATRREAVRKARKFLETKA